VLARKISAVQEAVRGAGRIMVQNYLECCAAVGIKAGREQEVYDEVTDVIFKLTHSLTRGRILE
jgi:DNA-binding FrmR family transcriptional regulator